MYRTSKNLEGGYIPSRPPPPTTLLFLLTSHSLRLTLQLTNSHPISSIPYSPISPNPLLSAFITSLFAQDVPPYPTAPLHPTHPRNSAPRSYPLTSQQPDKSTSPRSPFSSPSLLSFPPTQYFSFTPQTPLGHNRTAFPAQHHRSRPPLLLFTSPFP